MSTIIPVICISLTIVITTKLLGFLGIALAAIGMLSNLSVCLAIDVYGPVSDNAGGISEMSSLGEKIREITDALDSAGNTTAAIGKGFAIGSACLVGLALFGAFNTRLQELSSKKLDIQLTNPFILFSMLIGTCLPYVFSALTV